jgi:uncharacterized protein (DUF302 family)
MEIITIAGLASVPETMDKLEQSFLDHGITIYARIDQQSEAVKSGLSLKPLQVLIFGNPRAGVPLMNAVPLSALDLPLKLVCWEDDGKKVWLSYSSFSYLQKRFDLPGHLIKNLSAVENLIKTILPGTTK